MNGEQLFVPTLDQAVAIENYKNASKESLASANSMGDKLVAAAFSFATAYGAVVALVAPEEKPEAIVVVIPFILLAVAAVLGLVAQSVGLSVAGTDQLSELRSSVNHAIMTKRSLCWTGLAFLAAGVIAAGWIVNDQYAKPSEDSSAVAVQVWLTPAGVEFASQACGGGVTEKVDGTVEDAGSLADERVGIEVSKASCAAGPGTLYLDQDLIAGVRGPAAPA